jgi:hypothetical protein
MGARLNTVFHDGNRDVPTAVVYGHWAGSNPVDAATTLKGFFEAVEAQTSDRRYNDASYLAAKFVVYLASKGLDFLGVGIFTSADDGGPSCIAYVNCETLHSLSHRPTVHFEETSLEAEKILGQVTR